MKKTILFIFLILGIATNAQEFKVSEINVSDELSGDLYDSANKESIILLISGSGPTDRNGNTLGMAENNSLKMLAQGLAQNKYDVFTFDKRVVYILKNHKEITPQGFQKAIDDAETVVRYLKNTLGYKRVIIAGHSEGSLIGMIISGKAVDGFISLAGAGRPIDEILKEQIDKKAPILSEASNKILVQLKKGIIVSEVTPMLQSLYAVHNQPFLIEWMKWNPQTEIAKLNIPVLIINGTKDIQVNVSDAELLHKAHLKSELIIIENMNHIFKTILKDEENIPSYTNPDLPIHTDLIPGILNFLKKNNL